MRKLKLGDKVELSGVIFTARDKAHLYLIEKNGFDGMLHWGAIYHCGPIVKKVVLGYKVVSAGPTTSDRLSMYTPAMIKKYQIRAIIGKGGMDKRTVMAMKKYGCVYLSATGGTGALIASSIKKVRKVHKKEFGMPEAIYELEVEKMPLVVTIDSKGKSTYECVLKKSKKKYSGMINKKQK